MAMVHNATCKCGFSKRLTVGGFIDGYLDDSRFPYYCQRCGLVEANIAKIIGGNSIESPTNRQDEFQNAPTCPQCGSMHIDQYGQPPASMQLKKNIPALQAWRFSANKEGNLCPACKQMTLIFHQSSICID